MSKFVYLLTILSMTQLCFAFEPICNQQDLVSELHRQDRIVVPAKIYHYGKKEYMLENARLGGITEQVWDQFIMGPQTRYDYDSNIRNGLYGTLSPLDNNFATNEYNWINIIHIKESCRAPQFVLSLFSLYDDPRFKMWLSIQSSVQSQEFKQQCFADNGFPHFHYSGRFDSLYCQEIFEGFIEDYPVKIIHDHIIGSSWYIRDRDCIEDIQGDYSDLKNILFNQESILYQNLCERDGYHDLFLDMMSEVVNYFGDSESLDQYQKFESYLDRMH